MWTATRPALDKCQIDASCYVKLLDEPIPPTPTKAN